MNIVKHLVYKLELDSWEPTDELLQEELDRLVLYIGNKLTHAGNVRFRLESEVRE